MIMAAGSHVQNTRFVPNYVSADDWFAILFAHRIAAHYRLPPVRCSLIIFFYNLNSASFIVVSLIQSIGLPYILNGALIKLYAVCG